MKEFLFEIKNYNVWKEIRHNADKLINVYFIIFSNKGIVKSTTICIIIKKIDFGDDGIFKKFNDCLEIKKNSCFLYFTEFE